jgi:hypothetical protein
MAEQSSFIIPAAQVRAASLTVNRGLVGAPPAEVITSLQLSQQIQITDNVGNPATAGFSTFNFTWQPVPGQETNDLDAALAAAGWDINLPTLDPTLTYQIAITQVSP